jgi:hypothetical protein
MCVRVLACRVTEITFYKLCGVTGVFLHDEKVGKDAVNTVQIKNTKSICIHICLS